MDGNLLSRTILSDLELDVLRKGHSHDELARLAAFQGKL